VPVTDDAGLRDLLDRRRVAVIGCSATPGKAAHDVPAYLDRHGYEIHPGNPHADEILDRPAVDALADLAATVDLVTVFRPSEELSGIVDETLDRHADRGDAGALWLQLGIRDAAAVARAETAGLGVARDRCARIEHRRLID
jgi:predicted CoA-binding protein